MKPLVKPPKRVKQQKESKPKSLMDNDEFLLGIDKLGLGMPDLELGPRPEDWEDNVVELNKKKQTKQNARVNQIMKYLKFMKYPFHTNEDE
jgi:hypothetical protein